MVVDGFTSIIVVVSGMTLDREWTAGDDIVRIFPGVFFVVVVAAAAAAAAVDDDRSQSSQSSSSIRSVSIKDLLFMFKHESAEWADGGGTNVK